MILISACVGSPLACLNSYWEFPVWVLAGGSTTGFSGPQIGCILDYIQVRPEHRNAWKEGGQGVVRVP